MSNIASLVQPYIKQFKVSGGVGRGFCPFHSGGHASFSISMTDGKFTCWSGRCEVKSGTLTRFLILVGYPKEEAKQLSKAYAGDVWIPTKEQARLLLNGKDPTVTQMPLPEQALYPFHRAPVSLLRAGFKKECLQEFEVGWDMEYQRITFPVRDFEGNLAGVMWRTTPQDEERYGRRYSPYIKEFQEIYPTYCRNPNLKNYLYNGHKVRLLLEKEPYDNRWFVLVEGYKGCIWVHQAGYPNVAALQGSSMVSAQELAIQRISGTVILLLDGDDAGRKGTLQIGKQLLHSKGRDFVQVAECPTGKSPDDLTPSEITKILANTTSFTNWRAR